MKRTELLLLAALAVFTTGAALYVQGLRDAGRNRQRLALRTETLRQLEDIAQRSQTLQASAAAFQDLPPAETSALENLAKALFPGTRAEIAEQDPQPVSDGLVMRRASIRLSGIRFAAVGQLLERASFTSPPWFLEAVSLRAEGSEPGTGRAVLEMRAFTRP